MPSAMGARCAALHWSGMVLRNSVSCPRPRWPSAWSRLAAACAACLIAIGGCASVSLRTTGADTVADLQAEDAYKATYAAQMATVKVANQLLTVGVEAQHVTG